MAKNTKNIKKQASQEKTDSLVQTRKEQIPGASVPDEWKKFWAQNLEEMLVQQREAASWWHRLAQCWFAPDCASRKMLDLRARSLLALTGTAEALSRLTMDQHRHWAACFSDFQQAFRHPSATAFQLLAERCWADMSSASRVWGAIPSHGHAQMTQAWAELWCLPPGD